MSRRSVPALVTDGVLMLGATMRLTRLVTTDDLGWWYLRRPAERWAVRHDGMPTEDMDSADLGARSKLVSGLTCPWCVGYWIGFGTLAITAATSGRVTLLARGWRFVMATLTLNEVAANLGARLDG